MHRVVLLLQIVKQNLVNLKLISTQRTKELTKKYKALAKENAASIRQTIEMLLLSDRNSSSGPSRVDSITIVYGDDNVNPNILINSVDWS